MIRAIESVGPPAENGTMMVMGCEGKVSAASAGLENVSSEANAVRIIFRITTSPKIFTVVIARNP
jgi:hypothetical protein